MFKKHTALQAAAVFAAGLLLFSCDKTQQATELSVNEKAANFEASGGDKSITVTSNADWTVSCPADWVTVSPKAGSGNGTIKITVPANETFDVRSADITVAAGDKTQTIKVNQLSLAPSLLIDPATADVPAEGGEVTLNITSNAPWTLTIPEGVDWISAEPMEGTGSATVKVTVLQNVEREGRTAKLTVKETVNGASQELTVTQELGPLSRYSDSLALVAIYNASKGAEWTKGNWDLTKDMSTWTGVTLTGGRVTVLQLTTKVAIPAEWTLPAEIGDLTELTDLRISGNKLAGEIPEAVFGLTKLEKLYFQNDNLTGTLSSKLAQLTELTELYVDRNANMTGSIPKEIGSLKKLARINISQTGIGGEIPTELGQCEALLQFMAFKTNLSGTLPDIWDMPVLQTVMLHSNPGITGNLPTSLSKLKPLASGTAPSIQLYGCNLTGTIPDSFAELPEGTKQVHVQDNKMSGVISLTVQAHPNFASWKYSPQQEGYGLTLEEVNYRQTDSLALVAIYNAADGANWKEERRWDLTLSMDTWDGVKLTGGRVSSLIITAKDMIPSNWTLPKEIGELTELTVLKINQNKLTGELPEELFNLTKLTDLYFQINDLSGRFSDKYTNLVNLKNLYVNNNPKLEGSLPASIGQMTQLESINISQTSFSGTIPQELSQCSALKNIMAWKNNLSGEIPDFWDKLPNVGVIQFYSNPGITGPIPPTMGTLKKATGIQLKECNLTGNIPASFGGLEKCSNLQLNGNKLSGVVPAEVQAHPKWLATTGWKYETNILPQQEGYGLTLQ